MIEGAVERSLSDVLEELARDGYDDSFVSDRDQIRAVRSARLHRPEELSIERIERFEGPADPDEEAILLALRCAPHGCKGTYVLPYGKDMPTVDASLLERIPDLRAGIAWTGLISA